MAEPNTIYKMTVLTMLDKVDFPLSNTQISNFFLDHDYTDYFTIQQIIHGLVDSDLIRPESTHKNTQYHITPQGLETLKFFGDKITPAIDKDLNAYLEQHHLEMKNENSVMADFYKTTMPGFDVRCQLREKNIPMIDLTIHAHTKAQAETICRNWQEQNMEIYAYLMDTLIH